MDRGVFNILFLHSLFYFSGAGSLKYSVMNVTIEPLGDRQLIRLDKPSLKNIDCFITQVQLRTNKNHCIMHNTMNEHSFVVFYILLSLICNLYTC